MTSSAHTRRAPADLLDDASSETPLFGLPDVDFDALSEKELERLLFSDETEAPRRVLNLPTVAGLSLIGVGVVYLLQEQGLWAGDVSALVAALPWLAGVLIILLGFGVLSWRPRRRLVKKRRTKKKRRRRKTRLGDLGATLKTKAASAKPSKKQTRRLTKSRRDRKVFGVCGGLGERLGTDPTYVRIAFVIGTIFSGGPPVVVLYLALAYLLPEPDALTAAERLRIIRES